MAREKIKVIWTDTMRANIARRLDEYGESRRNGGSKLCNRLNLGIVRNLRNGNEAIKGGNAGDKWWKDGAVIQVRGCNDGYHYKLEARHTFTDGRKGLHGIAPLP